MQKYAGHPSQLYGIEEHRRVGGKGDGMRIIEVNNGKALMFTVSADRCGDISRMYYKGMNLGFFAPAGYVAPQFYEKMGNGFLKSFTAGFCTTCGLTTVGTPSNDNGEELPLHGTISHVPAENVSYYEENGKLFVKLTIRDASLFGHKLVLQREYECDTEKNEIVMRDKVKNIGTEATPYMILYHFNMGYPLLSENSVVTIEHNAVAPRDARAAEGIDNATVMEKPQAGFAEQCYYYEMSQGCAKIYNPDINTELSLNYNLDELPCFTEWKMMGVGEYVLGLEPGNCNPDGRVETRNKGKLKMLAPGEEAHQTIVIKIKEN